MSVSNSGPQAIGPSTPADILQMRAVEQRRRIHTTVHELRDAVRERLDVRRSARRHLLPAVGVVAVCGGLVGYAFGGLFKR